MGGEKLISVYFLRSQYELPEQARYQSGIEYDQQLSSLISELFIALWSFFDFSKWKLDNLSQ